MEDVTLYTTHCPMCNVLKKKLDMKHVKYTECDDVELMKSMGMQSAPMLQLGTDELMNFNTAVQWINKQEGMNE